MQPRGRAGAALWHPTRAGSTSQKQVPSANTAPVAGTEGNSSSNPEPGGFGKPKTGGSCCYLLWLCCSLHPSMLTQGGTGLQMGHRVPGVSPLMHGAAAAPSISWVPVASLLVRVLLLWLGKKSSRKVISVPLRGLGKGWAWAAGSGSTANPHFLVPRGFLASQCHPQHCLSHSQCDIPP